MKIQTHDQIDRELCGTVTLLSENKSRVEMKTSRRMSVDRFGLIHGGFIFGLADHAAMVAVNHPNVVLGSSRAVFKKPVRVGQFIFAEAALESTEGRKKTISVRVTAENEVVFEGTFTCFVLDKHVLE